MKFPTLILSNLGATHSLAFRDVKQTFRRKFDKTLYTIRFPVLESYNEVHLFHNHNLNQSVSPKSDFGIF